MNIYWVGRQHDPAWALALMVSSWYVIIQLGHTRFEWGRR